MDKIKTGAFTIVEVPDPDRHVEYNWWHSGDHIPENLALDGIVVGTRWAAPQPLMDARLIVHPGLAQHQYLVAYFMTDPVDEVWRDWVALGDRMSGLGRSYAHRVVRYVGNCQLLKSYVAAGLPVASEAIAFRPHRGVYVVMVDSPPADQHVNARRLDEVHIPAVLEVPGVSGACWFKSRGPDEQLALGDKNIGDPLNRHLIVFYLDDDPVAVSAAIAAFSPGDAAHPQALVTAGMEVVLAGGYETITDARHYDWKTIV